MSLPVKLQHMPARVATGAMILNSGLSKRGADEATTGMLHGMAAGTYPFLQKIPPQQFTRLLSAGEIVLGTALLLPVVPTGLAGAGLAAFAGGLLGLYLRTPGMREEGSLRPTQQGLGIAKDVWMLGIGLGFVVEALVRDRDEIDPAVDPPPDLVVEIDITSRSLDTFPLYAEMGVPEVWRFVGRRVAIYLLVAGAYQEATASAALPPLTSDLLTDFLAESRARSRTAWVRALRAWARQQRPPTRANEES